MTREPDMTGAPAVGALTFAVKPDGHGRVRRIWIVEIISSRYGDEQ